MIGAKATLLAAAFISNQLCVLRFSSEAHGAARIARCPQASDSGRQLHAAINCYRYTNNAHVIALSRPSGSEASQPVLPRVAPSSSTSRICPHRPQ